MTRKIIEYHGGRIWLDTTASGGARFCFTLPAAAGDEPPAVAAGSDPGDPVSANSIVVFSETTGADEAGEDMTDPVIPEDEGNV
jgi:hypothetical protein